MLTLFTCLTLIMEEEKIGEDLNLNHVFNLGLPHHTHPPPPPGTFYKLSFSDGSAPLTKHKPFLYGSLGRTRGPSGGGGGPGNSFRASGQEPLWSIAQHYNVI